MKAAFRRFIRCIPLASLPVSLAVFGETPMPSGQAMEPLIGVPYKLYARQKETEVLGALNCFTSVVFALRRSGYACPDMSFRQGLAYWWPQAKALRPGKTPLSGKGALLLSRTHFLLVHTDSNDNGLVDREDRVIHAYFRPVEISTLAAWMEEWQGGEIRYLALDDSFVCPTIGEVAGFRR